MYVSLLLNSDPVACSSKVNVSVGWKGKVYLLRRLVTWGKGGLMSKRQLRIADQGARELLNLLIKKKIRLVGWNLIRFHSPKCTWCCSQLLYHNKNRLFSHSWKVSCRGMLYPKSTWSVLKTIMLVCKRLTWPESGLRRHSHISEADRKLSSDRLSSHRMQIPRHRYKANGRGERG